MKLKPNILEKLRCPISKKSLVLKDKILTTGDGLQTYNITESGIPLFAEQFCSNDAKRQQAHYEKVAEQYIKNLDYPHTKEYMAYLDQVFKNEVFDSDLNEVAEICCGQGELLGIYDSKSVVGLGVDISQAMLESAVVKHKAAEDYCFIQGDATQLPLESESFSSVFMLGGIHHVSDREGLFKEVNRILKPGGRFYWREPVSDFFLWRWLRAIIYRVSPSLDAETEAPLLYKETVPFLEIAGLKLKVWKTYGFLGFCFFMNSDVLVFNRLFRFIPGIRKLTQLAIRFDDYVVKLPGLKNTGLQVVGVAEKPMSEHF
ncbi:MAG: class I SAM-dependent methyltransferase [Gammaproteobacteria bacterium]